MVLRLCSNEHTVVSDPALGQPISGVVKNPKRLLPQCLLHGAEGRALESRGPGAEAAHAGLGCGFGGTNSGFGRGLGFWLVAAV